MDPASGPAPAMSMKVENPSENPLELMNEMEEARTRTLACARTTRHSLKHNARSSSTPNRSNRRAHSPPAPLQKLVQALELAGAMLAELSTVQIASEPKVSECIALYLKRIEVRLAFPFALARDV